MFSPLLSSLNVTFFSVCCLSSSQHAPLWLSWSHICFARILLALPEAFSFPSWTSPPQPFPIWQVLQPEECLGGSPLNSLQLTQVFHVLDPKSGCCFLCAIQQMLSRWIIMSFDFTGCVPVDTAQHVVGHLSYLFFRAAPWPVRPCLHGCKEFLLPRWRNLPSSLMKLMQFLWHIPPIVIGLSGLWYSKICPSVCSRICPETHYFPSDMELGRTVWQFASCFTSLFGSGLIFRCSFLKKFF